MVPPQAGAAGPHGPALRDRAIGPTVLDPILERVKDHQRLPERQVQLAALPLSVLEC